MTPAQWRQAAVVTLWALAVMSFVVAAYALWASPSALAGVAGVRSFLAALVAVWWTVIFTRYSAGVGSEDTDGVLRALRAVFPWLTALRVALWSLELLAYSSGAYEEANPVALTALLTIELGFIFAKNAVYGTLARWAGSPAELLGRARLTQWLNLGAALSLGIGVVNLVPVRGLGDGPQPLPVLLMYGLHAALDVLAALFALQAVKGMPRVDGPQAEGRRG